MAKKLKTGDVPFMKCVGYGLTSYETGEEILRIRKGVITLENRDTRYIAETGLPVGGGSLGLTCSLCVTDADIEAAKKYIAENGD